MKPLKRRVHFIANGIYCDQISGGDIHFFEMVAGLQEAGHEVHFFGGHALKGQLASRFKKYELTLTDSGAAKPLNIHGLMGQIKLLWDYLGRFLGTLKVLKQIGPDDAAYAVSDYWFDVWPVVLSRAKRKIMIWHMEAPTLGQVIKRSRPDVPASRLNSLYYWASQNLSLRFFCRCRDKRMLYVHPLMHLKLLRMGYQQTELDYISFGVDIPSLPTPPPAKTYDVIWIGRVHLQKGIQDLLATFEYLAQRIPDFRAVLVGNLKADLQPEIERRKLSKCVEFAGFVSEAEKYRLFQVSRLFLMSSRFEGSPRVVAEALVSETPVVAYDVPNYRPIFGEFLRYVPCFDVDQFQRAAEATILEMRQGKNYLTGLKLAEFRQQHCWAETRRVFQRTLD
jgi:glycosyltransferase involved in cell wall biosynthesis